MDKKARGVIPKKASDIPRRIKVFIVSLVFMLCFGTLMFSLVEKIKVQQAFIRTIESLAFMFSEEIGSAKYLEIFLALFGVFLVWWALWSIADMFIEGKISEYLYTTITNKKVRKMKNHYIIVGGGRVGEEIAKGLLKTNHELVLVEKDRSKIEKLKKHHFVVIEKELKGDDESVKIFEKAGAKNAKAIVLVLPETEKNLMLTLMIAESFPNIPVYARADNPGFVSRLKKAGAKKVIVPETAAAEKFLSNI